MKRISFIDLIDALNIISESVPTTPLPIDSIPTTSPSYSFWNSHIREIEEERKFSEAALSLSAAMESATPPQWWENDGRHPRKSNSGGKIGKQILDRAIDLHRIRQKERQDHLFQCLKDGLDPLEKPILFSVAKQEWQPGNPVGFEREELIDFLYDVGIPHPFD